MELKIITIESIDDTFVAQQILPECVKYCFWSSENFNFPQGALPKTPQPNQLLGCILTTVGILLHVDYM